MWAERFDAMDAVLAALKLADLKLADPTKEEDHGD